MKRLYAVALALVALALAGAVVAEAQDKKVVRIWQTETEPQTLAVLHQLAAEFEKTRPNVEVKMSR